MQKKKINQKKRQREKGFILLIHIVLVLFYLYLNMCSYKHKSYLPGYAAPSRLRLSHSLDNLIWLVHCNGVVIDKECFGHPHLCMTKLNRNWLKMSHRFQENVSCILSVLHPVHIWLSSQFPCITPPIIDDEHWKPVFQDSSVSSVFIELLGVAEGKGKWLCESEE